MSCHIDDPWVNGLIKELQTRIAELEAWQKEALPLLQVVADSYGNRGKVQLEPGQTMQAHELIEKAKEPSERVK